MHECLVKIKKTWMLFQKIGRYPKLWDMEEQRNLDSYLQELNSNTSLDAEGFIIHYTEML